MSDKTGIEWCDSTVNPTMGCDGCELWSPKEKTCYAGILHDRYGGAPGFSQTFEQLTFWPGRMAKAAAWSDLTGTDRPDKPWLNGRPRHIFVSDMSDALSRAVTFDYLQAEIIDVVNSIKGQRHIWMWLTKQAPRMAEFSRWLRDRGVAWPANLWPGTSITRQANASRIAALLKVGDCTTTRFASAEPMLEEVRFPMGGIRLVIVGGESGPRARPCNLSWIRSIVEQCKASGVACFVKQLGSKPLNPDGSRYPTKDRKGGDSEEWPPDLCVRQFPHA